MKQRNNDKEFEIEKINNALTHCLDVIAGKIEADDCSIGYFQLSVWLAELKQYKEKDKS